MSYSVKQLAHDKGISEEALRSYGVRDGLLNGTPCVEIAYHNPDGTPHARYQIRLDPYKKWFWNVGTEPITIYGAHLPVPIVNGVLIIVEGPSDCWALWEGGYTAIGFPGAGSAKHLHAEHLHSVTALYISKEPGSAGEAFPDRVAARAWNVGFQGEIFAMPMLNGIKDPRELRQAVGTDKFRETFAEAIAAATRIERPPTPEPEDDAEEAKGKRGPSQAKQLIDLVDKHGVELFRSHGEAFAKVPLLNGAKALFAVRSHDMRSFLNAKYYEETENGPRSQSMSDAITTIISRAVHDRNTSEIEVDLRVGHAKNEVHLDLGGPRWEEILITPTGWELLPHQRFFRRAPGMRELPAPQRGGSLSLLRPFINLSDKQNDEEWALIAGWLVASIATAGPYAPLALIGPQGSGKTVVARMLRQIIDPSEAPLVGKPRQNSDLIISANASHVLTLDNLSHIDGELSDLLCCIATGIGYRTRRLYTDNDEVIINIRRAILLTSIVNVVQRGDLADRSVTAHLPRIPEEVHLDEDELWPNFERVLPSIIGALLDAVTLVLANRDKVRQILSYKPRMLDHALAAVAAEEAYGVTAGTWIAAHGAMRGEAYAAEMESPFPLALVKLLADRAGAWEGDMTTLLSILSAPYRMADGDHFPRGWPTDTTRLSSALRRITPAALASGIDIDTNKKNKHPETRRQLIKITRVDIKKRSEGDHHPPEAERCSGGENQPSEASQPSSLDRAMDSSRRLAEGQPSDSLRNGDAARGHEEDEINRLFNDLVL